MDVPVAGQADIPTPPRMTTNSVFSHLFIEARHELLEAVRSALE
jgi:hypothetical protein